MQRWQRHSYAAVDEGPDTSIHLVDNSQTRRSDHWRFLLSSGVHLVNDSRLHTGFIYIGLSYYISVAVDTMTGRY